MDSRRSDAVTPDPRRPTFITISKLESGDSFMPYPMPLSIQTSVDLDEALVLVNRRHDGAVSANLLLANDANELLPH